MNTKAKAMTMWIAYQSL